MRPRPALVLGAIALLIVAGVVAAWALFLRGDNVAPLALPSVAPSAAQSAAQSASASTAPGSAGASAASLPPASGAAVDAGNIPGIWSIGANSVVGYRVRERLANLSADSDAVGRTDQITGTVTMASSEGAPTVADAAFSVDMTTLASDRQMRDNRLRNDGIETDSFPTATFTLTSPVALPADAATGAQIEITLHGDLTLHGVTKTVDIPAKAQLNGSLIQVQGSLPIAFADYGITPPNIAGFVSVEDNGTLEFLINLTRA